MMIDSNEGLKMMDLDLLSVFFSVFLMLILTISNIKSLKSQIQMDYRITIFIIGLLDSIIIILIKLQNPPLVLEPIILYPIIISMLFLIIIGICQNKTIAPLDIKYNIDYIAAQISKLNNELPRFLEIKSITNSKLEELKEINKNELNLLGDRICECIDRTQNEILKSMLQHMEILNITNEKLDSISNYNNDIRLVISKEIEKLSSDFSQDVISGIDNLSRAWSNSIKEHFGANFKEFNDGVKNMLSWQNENKNILLDSTSILQKYSDSFERLEASLNSILLRDKNMLSLYNEVSKIMKDYINLNTELDERLSTISKLGESAGRALETMNLFFNKLNSYLTTTNENMINNTKKTINDVLLSSVANFKKANMKIVHDLNDRDKKILGQIKIHTKNIEHLNTLMLDNNKIITDSYKSTLESIKNIMQSTKDNMDSISKHSIEILEDTSSKAFKNLVNKYLDSLEQLNIATFESSKESRNLMLEDIREINTELKEYFKDNASLIDTTNTKILNVLNQVQQYVVDISSMSKNININTSNTLEELSKSLNDISDGFRGDYDWFLRRIREIIGSRIK